MVFVTTNVAMHTVAHIQIAEEKRARLQRGIDGRGVSWLLPIPRRFFKQTSVGEKNPIPPPLVAASGRRGWRPPAPDNLLNKGSLGESQEGPEPNIWLPAQDL